MREADSPSAPEAGLASDSSRRLVRATRTRRRRKRLTITISVACAVALIAGGGIAWAAATGVWSGTKTSPQSPPTPQEAPPQPAPKPVPEPTPEPEPEPAPEPSPQYPPGIDDPNSLQVVVNKLRPLNPIDWAPDDLRVPGAPNDGATTLRDAAATAYEQMFAAAQADGVWFTMISGYRSYSRQVTLFDQYTARDGLAAALTYSARPGFSEHQTGLTADFDDGAGCMLDYCFGETAAGQWLRGNAYRFGYILRYDLGEEPVVGYMYEPWHFRYVGPEVAGEMHAQGIVNLEDYYGLPAAPDYR